MKRLTKRFLLAFGLCLLMAGFASADITYDVPFFVNQVLWSNSYGGHPVGPVGASLASGKPTGPYPWDFDAICNDFGHTITVPTTYHVDVIPLEDLVATTATRFMGNLNGYRQAAWLIDEMYATIGSTKLTALSLEQKETVGKIQYAIWRAFDPSVGWVLGDTSTWGADAAAATLNSTYGDGRFVLYTPTGIYGQEHIGRVPEPAMLGTLLFGFLGAGLFWRRRSIAGRSSGRSPAY